MSKRTHNVFFNTHTVSGIVISIGLYIIFFAGSFSFFKEEIHIWQNGKAINSALPEDIDWDAFVMRLDTAYDLHGRDLDLRLLTDRNYLRVSLSPSKDTTASEKAQKSHYLMINIQDLAAEGYYEGYDLGEFLYRLHFLDPIPYPYGRTLAGFIALFFLFALVTGVIVHWKKSFSNFYKFDPKASLKRVWTDAHTAIGFIGLPYQLIYAATGSYMIIGAMAYIPTNFINKDKEQVEDWLYEEEVSYDWTQQSSDTAPLTINSKMKEARAYWGDIDYTMVQIHNYNGQNMVYSYYGEPQPKDQWLGNGRIDYDAYKGNVIFEKTPVEANYNDDLDKMLDRLHFGDFGGLWLRIIYFILGLLTCFVIISGVLIWVEARNKKTMTIKQRKYTAKVGHIYLAICLAMLPVTALAFSFSRITHGMFEQGHTAIYSFYFGVWLVMTVFYRLKRDNYFTNKNTLLLGSIFGFFVPLVNGLTSGNWIWNTFSQGQYEIFTIDVLWIILSVISLSIYFSIDPKIKERSTFWKFPISK